MRGVEISGGYLLRVEKGRELMVELQAFCQRRGIETATISGIGAVCDVELGYFDGDSKSYKKQNLGGEYELVHLEGNVSLDGAAPMVHAHAVLADQDFRCRGGHLFAATVAVTTEIVLRIADAQMVRQFDADTGLKLLDLAEV